jgi:hypothetical protein
MQVGREASCVFGIPVAPAGWARSMTKLFEDWTSVDVLDPEKNTRFENPVPQTGLSRGARGTMGWGEARTHNVSQPSSQTKTFDHDPATVKNPMGAVSEEIQDAACAHPVCIARPPLPKHGNTCPLCEVF